jgi:biotin carboxyl carrier protein
MKSYWIAAMIVSFSTWPLSSNAYVVGTDQVKADEKTAQTESLPSENTQYPAKAQTVSAPVSANPAPQTAAKAATAPQAKSSYFLVELSKTLKVNKLKPGDKIKAQVAQDVISHGKVIIPVETEVIGHVTEVTVRDKETNESRLGIIFDKIVLKHFHDIRLQAVVQAVSPPVQRQSLSLESQMLPPSMVGAPRQGSIPSAGHSGGSSGSSGGSGSSGSGRSSPNTVTPVGSGDMSNTYETPITVKQSPSTNTSVGSSAAQLETVPGAKPMSIGMPLGIIGLKGLSLSTAPSTNTPGPVIVSNTQNVKLESGTQILLRVVTIEMPKAESAKR